MRSPFLVLYYKNKIQTVVNEPIITKVQETPQSSLNKKPSSNKKKRQTIILIIFILLLLPFSYYVWNYVLSPEAQEAQGMRETLNYYTTVQNNFASDTYGGQTPEETIQLFIKAMEADDMVLASKYMARDSKTGLEDPQFLETLNSLSAEQKQQIISYLKQVKTDDGGINGYSKEFTVRDDNNMVIFGVTVYKVDYTPVWKIQSM